METPETIRTSLQAGEWVTHIDFKGAYFHTPIHCQSRKYMRFHVQGRSNSKALSFGLSTAPTEFTVVAKEVKLMALQKGIRIHQYIDDWLERATSHQTCLQHTQTLVALCRELDWLVNRSLHPHLRQWLEENNVPPGQPLHPLKHALQIFRGASKEGWGIHLNEHTARGTWSLPESKLHINHLELKVVFLILKELQDLCLNNIVLIATDNTTVEVGPAVCPSVQKSDL